MYQFKNLWESEKTTEAKNELWTKLTIHTAVQRKTVAYTRLSTTVMSPFTQLQLQKYDPTAWAAAVQCRISFFLFVYRSIPSWWYLKRWKSCTDKGRKIKAVFSSKSNLWQTFGEWLYILPFPVLQSIVLPHHGCTSGAPSRKFSCQIAPAVLQKASCSLLFLPKLSVLLGHMLPSNKSQSFLHMGLWSCATDASSLFWLLPSEGFWEMFAMLHAIALNPANTEDVKLGDAEIMLVNWK